MRVSELFDDISCTADRVSGDAKSNRLTMTDKTWCSSINLVNTSLRSSSFICDKFMSSPFVKVDGVGAFNVAKRAARPGLNFVHA